MVMDVGSISVERLDCVVAKREQCVESIGAGNCGVHCETRHVCVPIPPAGIAGVIRDHHEIQAIRVGSIEDLLVEEDVVSLLLTLAGEPEPQFIDVAAIELYDLTYFDVRIQQHSHLKSVLCLLWNPDQSGARGDCYDVSWN